MPTKTCIFAKVITLPIRKAYQWIPGAATSLAIGLALGSTASTYPQADDFLLRRWVGTHQGRPFHLEFYGDTMLIVNDSHVLDYVATHDSVMAFGDTSFAVHYRFALDRLLLRTVEGNVITMSPQPALARPLWGRWLGAPSRTRDRHIDLWMYRNGTAQWRWVPGGTWTKGEWDRFTRIITFTWLPDSTLWTGLYDPDGNSLLFDEAVPESGAVILRRVFR